MADNQFINFNSQDVADMYRRNQYARMLQEQANAPIERPSYKGIEAPLNATQGAAKMAAALLAGYQYSSANESYAKEKAAAEQKMVDERERSNQAYTDFQAGIAPKPGFGASGSVGDYGGQEMPSQARSDSERLAHLLSSMGSADERVSRSAKNYLDYDDTQAQEKARAAKDEITRKDKEAERKRLQDNADRTYNLQLESLKERRLPTQKETAETDKAAKSKANVAILLKRLDDNYKALRDIGGMRTQTANPLSNIAASVARSLPYAAQSKKASLLREQLDSDLQAIVKPAMVAAGMTAKETDTPLERENFLKTLGGTGISYEANQPILERVFREVVGGEDNPYSKESRIKSVMDKYAPPKGK